MNVNLRTLRPYAPLLVLLVTIAIGWMVFVRPLSAEHSRAFGQLASLRQHEIALRREVSDPSPRALDADPALRFERQTAQGDAAPVLLEHLARLASAARARNLLMETVEGGAISAQRDPRIALFDIPVTHMPIRVAFDTDYASLGRFLWALRDLPTTVEIRSLSVGVPPGKGDGGDGRTDVLRVSLTLHAYSRAAEGRLHAAPATSVVASNVSSNGAAR